MEHLTFITRLFDYSTMKVQMASILAFISSFLLTIPDKFLGVSLTIFTLLFVVMMMDYVTGLAASKKEGKKFTSKKGLNWAFKFGSYLTFLCISYALRREVLNSDLNTLVTPLKLMHFYLLTHIFYWETKSLDENFERLGYSIRILKLADVLFLSLKKTIKKK